MPSKKRKYNARFPAGRIKKIMQTDEEVGKVAQAVPIIISRTLELFVESLLTKAFQVTVARSAKTLSPAHVKHCILAEARFDFLRHLVKNIPDVSAAEEKDELSAENSPNSSRFPDMQVPTGRVVREDSNSSSSSDLRLSQANSSTLDHQTPTTAIAVDLTKKITAEPKRTANFYNETLNLNEDRQGVIKINPTYATAQPSTSGCTNHVKEAPTPVHNQNNRPLFHIDYSLSTLNNNTSAISTPLTPLLNIDFSKGVASPEIKVLDTSIASLVGDHSVSVNKMATQPRSYAKASKDIKKVEIKAPIVAPSMSVEHINSGNLQIDEDYDT